MAGNRIHPTAVVGEGVELGADNEIGPYAALLGPCRIGDRNWIGPHAVLGTPGQVRGGPHPPAGAAATSGVGVSLGDDNVVRDFVTVQQPTCGRTLVGSRCYLMTQSHVPHDAELGDGVTLANSVQIGGHSRVGPVATLGLGAVVHQRRVIGPGAMVGMGAVVTRDVPPFALVVGSPAAVQGVNRVGMQREGFSPEGIDLLATRYAGTDHDLGPSDVPPALADAFAWWQEAA